MNNNLKLQLGNIRASFQKSFYEVEHARISPFYGNLHGLLSRAALRRVAGELLRLKAIFLFLSMRTYLLIFVEFAINMYMKVILRLNVVLLFNFTFYINYLFIFYYF